MLLAPVPTHDFHDSLISPPGHVNPPRIAAHLAVLNERAADIRLDVDLDGFAAVGALHQKLVCRHLWHTGQKNVERPAWTIRFTTPVQRRLTQRAPSRSYTRKRSGE